MFPRPKSATVKSADLTIGAPRCQATRAMSISESTCWTVIRAAAAGSPADRDELGRRYLGVVRAYLAARWRDSTLRP